MKDGKELGRLYSMLSTNDVMVANYLRVHKTKNTPHYFHQAFMTAGKYFEVIDAPTRGILVPYQEGNAIIEKIIAVTYFSEIKQELKKAQQYIVNVFPYQLRKLIEMGLVRNIRNDVELLYLLPDCSEYYNQSYGLVDASEDLPIGGNYVI
jgi:CRISPR-associated endonuclease/helicase Cas3